VAALYWQKLGAMDICGTSCVDAFPQPGYCPSATDVFNIPSCVLLLPDANAGDLRCPALPAVIEYMVQATAIPCLTNRWSQPLAVVMTTFNFMKQFPMLATLAAASGGSAPSR
jgi:hypothetical protein